MLAWVFSVLDGLKPQFILNREYEAQLRTTTMALEALAAFERRIVMPPEERARYWGFPPEGWMLAGLSEVEKAEGPYEEASEIGDLLFALVNLARWKGVHAEDALNRANQRFKQRYIGMEKLAAQRELDFTSLPLGEKEKLWQKAKGMVG